MIKIQLIITPPLKVTGFAFVYSEQSHQPIIEGSMGLKADKPLPERRRVNPP